MRLALGACISSTSSQPSPQAIFRPSFAPDTATHPGSAAPSAAQGFAR